MNSNYWALILGGSSGLGLATAKKLASHGYHILILHRDRRSAMDEIEKGFDEIRAFGNQLMAMNVDVLNAEKRTDIISNIQNQLPEGHQIKVLIHSVAKGTLKPMYSESKPTLVDTDFKITFDAMALSLYDWTKALVQAGLFAGDSRIISFTSEGNTKALPNYSAVSVAKVALEALTRSIALEFAPIGVKANCIQAGITMTKSLSMIPGYEQIKENALKRNPQKRLTLPEDVANAVYLLTMDEAKWITGTVIKVDGGESLM
ncbi:enoyl-[acyl-carrier protein] reductase I [Maribacter caenipelagi]|uniref:Enoyl-[acyl-carrier protein] reductase I n=1 Tax=Maribacter caenipelagi TaxID=1447781 RepID=A0A4R7D2I2_9FLAO|nr:SDR family oxidoreductase [Maribacter caenipelagi]TDS15189.1 enoyl-[acyl-carrier protein] reductase I [Maribacter caenipelagi]